MSVYKSNEFTDNPEFENIYREYANTEPYQPHPLCECGEQHHPDNYWELRNEGVLHEDIYKCECGMYYNRFMNCENAECGGTDDVYVLDLNVLDRGVFMSELCYPEIRDLEAEIIAKRDAFYGNEIYDLSTTN